jgi:hypothetical protein
MSLNGYEEAASGSRIDQVWYNDIAEQLGIIPNTGLYPFNVTLQVPIDLSSDSADIVYLLHPSRNMTLYKFIVTYTEATSGDVGKAIKLGKETDDDYYYTGLSATSKAQYYEDDLTLLKTDVVAGDTVILTSSNVKTGTGEVIVTIEYQYTPS